MSLQSFHFRHIYWPVAMHQKKGLHWNLSLRKCIAFECTQKIPYSIENDVITSKKVQACLLEDKWRCYRQQWHNTWPTRGKIWCEVVFCFVLFFSDVILKEKMFLININDYGGFIARVKDLGFFSNQTVVLQPLIYRFFNWKNIWIRHLDAARY